MTVLVTYRRSDKLGPYVEAVRAAGLEPIAAAPGDLPPDKFAGLVLTGGTDVNPELYGARPARDAERPDRERDEMEARLVERADAAGIPVLAICRGLQLLNAVRGGKLLQHIDGHSAPGVRQAHGVAVRGGTVLAGITGAGEFPVNSRHHQAADPTHIGRGLIVSATAPDGTIEGLEDPSKPFLVAVQWHPEERVATDEQDRKLFEAFARAVASRRK